MKRALNKLDAQIALGLAFFVSLLAFAWSYPYPHPDLWPILSDLRPYVNAPLLGVLGRLGIGLFTGVTYIVLRIVWLLGLEETDEFPDRFVYNQLIPLFGSLSFATLPAVWRSAQFLSPDFLFLVAEMCAVLVWLMRRGHRRLLAYSGAYFVMGTIAGVNPFAFGVLLFAVISDCIARWQGAQFHGQKEDDAVNLKLQHQELIFSVSAGVVGLLAGIFLLARFSLLHDFSLNVPKIFFAWLAAWLSAFDRSVTSPFMLTVAGGIIATAVAMAFGRRIRMFGEAGLPMARFMSVLVVLFALIAICRSHDGDARCRLAMIQSFVRSVVDDAKGAKWLFSDGRFDAALRYECSKRGVNLTILDVMNPPQKDEEQALGRLAPEIGDRALFAAGGAEVFRAWARERPDRLAESAWFLGGGILRQFGKVEQSTCGTVLRVRPKEGVPKAFAEANARQAKMFAEARKVACGGSRWSRLFGCVDAHLREKFDALLWRVARQAAVRADECAASGDLKGAQDIRAEIQLVNEANVTLRLQGSALERLLPTANLVVTAREGLEIALKRADFALAQRYAREVLVASPDDPSAHFAIGMVSLEVKDFREAVRQFEKVLKMRPNEPAALNNLALAYLKLNRVDEARATAETALKSNPNSDEIKKNLAAILKARRK